jgi:hypothetical protein
MVEYIFSMGQAQVCLPVLSNISYIHYIPDTEHNIEDETVNTTDHPRYYS